MKKLPLSKLFAFALAATAVSSLPASARNGQAPKTLSDGNLHGDFFHEFKTAKSRLPLLISDDQMRLKTLFDWARGNQIELFKQLRAKAPIFVAPKLPIKGADYPVGDTVVLSMRDDVLEALNRPEIFSIRNYVSKFEPSMGSFMLDHDKASPYNTREKPWMRQMMPMSDLPKVRSIVSSLTEKAIDDGVYIGRHHDGTYFARLEVVNQLARKVPVDLTRDYFGLTGVDDKTMFRWSRATQDDYFHNLLADRGIHAKSVTAGQEMKAHLARLIAERRAAIESGGPTPDDILTKMLRSAQLKNRVAEDVAAQLVAYRDERIGTNLIGTLIGGVETSQAAITQALAQLLRRPEALAGAKKAAETGDDDTLAKYVWEALRFDPVNPFVVRYAERDYTIAKGTPRAKLIRKGSIVFVGTASAMFDNSKGEVPNPYDFSISRPDSVYFHLGYGHHRCLGDYVSMVQVPEIIKHLLLKKNLRPALGGLGVVSKFPDTGNDQDRSFPEHFAVEWDADAPASGKLQISDKNYAFDEYLNDFDRHAYRSCLAGEHGYASIPSNVYKHFLSNTAKGLLWCRLQKTFRTCMFLKSISDRFSLVEGGEKHRSAMMSCKETTGALTKAEWAFYHPVMLNRPLPIPMDKIPTDQSRRVGGWEFEDHLKFYDRGFFRDAVIDPAGIKAMPQDEHLLMYSRLPFEFRICMANRVLLKKMSREDGFRECQDGMWIPEAGQKEGGLTPLEKYYYRTIILGQKLKLEEVKE